MGFRGESLTTLKSLGSACSLSAKPCDSCKTAPSAVFCRVDSASLCLTCDTKIHAPNKFYTRHERVWMCEVCEHAPAAVTCKADAAALCVACDSDIHSANPLASRHERVPIEPFVDAAESLAKSPAFDFLVVPTSAGMGAYGGVCNGHAEMDPAAWLLPNPNPNPNPNKLVEGSDHVKSGGIFFNDVDTLLDFEFGSSVEKYPKSAMDGLVPVQTKPALVPAPAPAPIVSNPISENCFEIDFGRSKLTSLTYLTQSISQSVSSSSLDVGIVPDGNCLSEISYPFVQSVNSHNSTDPTSMTTTNTTTTSQATQLCGLDREARVLRYREKRKNRKFEKTIRYASRKAYAETRPRIKGRFAKRTDLDTEMDNIYGSHKGVFVAEAQYGVVPTF